jgi:hypothetical protein
MVCALGHKAIEAGVLGEDVDFLFEDVAERILVLRHGRWKPIRASWLQPRRVKGILSPVPLVFMHPHRGLDQAAQGGGQQRTYQGNIGEGRRRNRVRPVLIMLLFKVVRISEVAEGIVFPFLPFRSVKGHILGVAFVEDAPVGTPFLDARAFKGRALPNLNEYILKNQFGRCGPDFA